jgi:predicted dehydrogenase
VGEYLPGWHPYEDYRAMYASRRDLGGGVLLTQIHEFDYLYGLFGLPRRVFAMGGHLSRLEIDVEDTASVLMECESEGRSLPVRLDLDYLQRPPFRGCTVIGDRGKAVVDFGALTFQRFDEEGRIAESEVLEGFQRNDLFVSELTDFLDCVETRRNPCVPLTEGLQSLQMAIGARKSLESGNVVELGSSGLAS